MESHNDHFSVHGILQNTANVKSTWTGWHHIAFVKYGKILGFFVDGNNQGIHCNFKQYIPNGFWEGVMIIGRNGSMSSDNRFSGYIDELHITKGAKYFPGKNFTPPAYELEKVKFQYR